MKLSPTKVHLDDVPLGGDLLRWREQANAHLRTARDLYDRVIAMGFTGRTIAAAARVGEMARA